MMILTAQNRLELICMLGLLESFVIQFAVNLDLQNWKSDKLNVLLILFSNSRINKMWGWLMSQI